MIGRSQVRQGAAVNTGNASSDTRAIAARSSVGATPKPAASTAVAKPTPRQARLNMEMEYDTFDTVLEHLVAEGYADTEEAALVIMANMSEEWRQSIVEGAVPMPSPASYTGTGRSGTTLRGKPVPMPSPASYTGTGRSGTTLRGKPVPIRTI